MKKTLLLSAVAALLLSAVSAVVYVNNERDSMDDLFNANVEALANGEGMSAGCYGPKRSNLWGQVMCKCKNNIPCRDEYGCF